MIHPTIFVTFPRSGHHWLIRSLKSYFGDEMQYCEFYSHCNVVGCVDGCNMQKNHDLFLDLVIPEGWQVIVQSRNAEDAIRSWWDVSPDMDWEIFRPQSTEFYNRWMEKWWDKYPQITYEERAAFPVETLCAVIFRLCGAVDVARAQRAVAANKTIVNQPAWVGGRL